MHNIQASHYLARGFSCCLHNKIPQIGRSLERLDSDPAAAGFGMSSPIVCGNSQESVERLGTFMGFPFVSILATVDR